MCGRVSSPDCGTAWPPPGTPTASRSCPTHTAGTGTLGYTDPVSKVVIVVDPRLRDMDASNLGPPRIGTAIYFYWGSRAVIMNSVTN